jgi:hypothetical protein
MGSGCGRVQLNFALFSIICLGRHVIPLLGDFEQVWQDWYCSYHLPYSAITNVMDNCLISRSRFGTEMLRLKWQLHTQRVKYVEQLVK